MKKFAFVHIPKTGGTYLMSKLGLNPSENTLAWHNTTRGAIHPRQRDAKDNSFVFSVVRNPWARLLSTYFYCMRKHPMDHIIYGRKNSNNFGLWVDSLKQEYGESPPPKDRKNESDYFWLAPQYDWLFSKSGVMVVDKLDKIEQSDYYLSILSEKIKNHEDVAIKNETKHAHYSTYYSKSSMDLVYKWYKQDIEKFGYEFEYLKIF